MREVARLIARVLENISSEEVLAEVRRSVDALTDRFPLYAWKLAAAALPLEPELRRCCTSSSTSAAFGDFGIGTYIRNLIRALARLDQENRYTLIARPQDVEELAGLGPNFRTAVVRARQIRT